VKLPVLIQNEHTPEVPFYFQFALQVSDEMHCGAHLNFLSTDIEYQFLYFDCRPCSAKQFSPQIYDSLVYFLGGQIFETHLEFGFAFTTERPIVPEINFIFTKYI
jgi:hypothetical protein